EQCLMSHLGRCCRAWLSLGGLVLTLPYLMGQGCATLNSLTATSGGNGVVSVHSPAINGTVTSGDVVTVVYDASAGPGSPFYDTDGISGTGDEVTFASGLDTGTGRFTQLQTRNIPAGAYHIGVTANGSTAYAPGVLTIGVPAVITFTSPVSQVKVGGSVNVPV